MKLRPTNFCTIKCIFPGGYIPSLAQTLISMEKHGLNVRSMMSFQWPLCWELSMSMPGGFT